MLNWCCDVVDITKSEPVLLLVGQIKWAGLFFHITLFFSFYSSLFQRLTAEITKIFTSVAEIL